MRSPAWLVKPGDMRRQHDLVEREQRVVLRRWLLVEHVQPRRGDAAFGQSRRERRLIDDAATRRVDEDGARFHLRELAAKSATAARL